MTSEQRRQQSEAFWFGSPAARNVLEEFVPPDREEETILTGEGQEPKPVALTPDTNIEDVVRNAQDGEWVTLKGVPDDFNPVEELAQRGLRISSGRSIFPEEERSLTEEVGVGVARGIDQTQAMGFGLLGLMGEALEVEGLSDLGVEGYKRNMEEAAKNMASVQDPFEEIGGVGDAATYAAGVLGEQLPQLLVSLIGGGVGGYTAKAIAKKVVANEIGKRVAAGLEKEAAEKVVANLVAQKALRGFDVPVVREGVERMAAGIGQEAMQQATKAGALGGAYVANVGQIAGGSFSEIEQETGERDPVNALGFALLGGALETAGEAIIAAPLANKLIGGKTVATISDIERPGGLFVPIVRNAGNVAGTATSEGLTERGQTFLEQAAVGAADPNRTVAEVTGTPEAQRERDIATVAGAVAGGGFGGVSQVASYLIPETAKAVQSKLQQRQAEQPQEEQPPAGVLTGDWSQPVDVGGIKMQRSSTGTWAALNPPEDLDPAAPRNQLPDGTNVVVLRAAAGENNAWLINEAESALSDLNEGKFEEPPPLPQNQEEQEIDEEDRLDTPAELRELEEGLGIDVPIKSAEESARTIDDAYTEEERKRQSPFALRYMERRIAVENARKERENQRMLDWGRVMARQPDEARAFVDGLVKGESKVSIASLGKEPGEEGFTETTGVFAGRRNNGNAIFYISKLGPRASGPIGPNQGRIELKPEQFNRVTLARPDADTRPLVSPFEEAMRDLLGDNPSKQEAGQALGSPFTGKGAPQETTIRNRVGGGPIPVLVSWFNKKGEKGTVIPKFRGKFTNSPLTTVFQMNEGLEVTVPDEQLTDLSPDIQVEAVSDKKGGRKNIVTAVNLWGRTYRRGLKSPMDFSVDEGFSYEGRLGQAQRQVAALTRSGKMSQERAARALTKSDDFGRKIDARKTMARKRGLWIFDDIYRNSPERIQASEAARRGAETRQGGPLDAQLRRVAGNIEKLDPVESTFYEDDYVRATDFLENSNLNEEEKRLAQKMAQDKIISAYEKIASSSRGAPFRTEGREKIAKRLTEVLAELRAEALAEAKDKALDSIYGEVRGGREIRSAQTRVNRLTGKALGSVRQQSPERSLEKLGTSQRSLAKTPNETQKQAFEDLENFLEGQALSGQSREKIEKGILDRIEKGTNAMLNKAKSRLEKEMTEGLKGRERGEMVRAINQVADRYRRLKNFNPIGIATRAAFSAKRSIRRDAANTPIEGRANFEQVLGAPPPQAIGQREQAGDSQKGTGERTEDSPFEALAKKEEGQSKPADTIEDGQERFTRLSNEDIDLILRSRGMLENERGGQIKGQISTLTSAQKKRAKQITNYLIGKTTYETLYPESANRGRDTGAVVADADAGQRRTGEILSGATQSVARRPANPNPARGSDRVGGRNQGAAGNIQASPVQRDGGSGVPAPLDPQTVRERARAATRRFVQSFARLTDAEAAARSDVEIERARQAILNERDPAEAVANRVAISSTAASVADLASRSNADLLRGAAAEIAREQADRDAVNTARKNLGALLRSGAFADANSFIDSVASNTRLPRDMAIRAKEFAKLARRGINFNNVGIQIGRFGADTSWAGYLTGSDGSYNIAINLDAVHDRDSVVNTMLHELQHVVLKEKIARRIPLNRVEQEALDRLEGIRRDTVVRAARDRGLNVPDQPSDADVARLSEELYQQSLPDVENADRALASLRNLDEFVVEVSSNPELADLMVRLGFGQGKGQVTMLGALKNAWDSLVQFITGIKADPNSPLAKAFKDSWIVSFANSGADVNLEEYTIPEVRRTAMADELARLAEINAFIDARIQQDNLAGTTEDRNRLLAEWSKINSNPKTAPARKARKKAAKQKKAQAEKQAEPEPKPETPKKTEPKKAEPPKKTEAKKETPQKPPPVKKAVKTAQTKTVKPQSPASSDNEMTQAWKTLSEDEFVKWTKENGYGIGDDPNVARMVYRSNRRTAGLNNNPAPAQQATQEKATEQQATGDTVQGSESVARSRPVDTNSDKFKQWFKQSAVTNRLVGGRDNQPLRMYHGSPYDLRAVFRSEADIQREMGVSRWGDVRFDQEDFGNEGIYFTTDPNYSSVYSRQNAGANTTPVYLSIQNPYFVNERDTWWESVSRFFKALRAVAGGEESWNRFEAEDENRFFTRRIENISNPLSSVRSSGYVSPRTLKRLRDQGYDGIINLAPNGNRNAPEIIVFSPTQIKSAITNSGEFSSINPNINESVARSRRPFASDTATTYNGKTYTRPGLIFGENANLDPRAQELVAILKRAKKAAEQYANLKGEELNRLVRKYYKNQPAPTDLINDALGNLDNPLTDQQFNEIKRLELTDPEAAVKKRIAYLSENRARFRTERQAPALLALPEELAEFLREIGKDGDLAQLQQQALDLGIPKGDMAAAFAENLGIYLTRSYNAFIDQEGWEKSLRREDRELGEHSRMSQMRNTIRATLIGQRADELMADAMAQGRTLSRAEAERRAKEGTTTEEVDQMLESYIAYTREEPSSESFSGLRLPGRQNIKSLEQRKMLSDALREFYGQVENPAVNFVTSYAKLSSLIANHKFQTDLKNLGLKEGWLWDQEKNRGQRPPAGYERIAADNDKSLKVLAGLYARSDLVRGLRETFPPNSMEAAQWWLHPFMKLTGLSMGMKTVGSIASQIRNYWSSYAPMIAGGNFTLADLFRPEWRKNWKEAHGVAIANVFRQYKGDRKAITDRIKRLYELGVMGESLTVGLLNDLTRLGKDASVSDEQFFNNFEKILKKPGRRVWNATKQVWEKAEQIYGMTDDVFKVFTYLSEYDKYKRVYPSMSDAELEQKAANIARDIHWTYSKAPAAVNELKKFPFIAPFITFTTETIRITANLGKLAIKERRDGQQLREQGLRENNAELVRQGDELLKISNKRLRGMAAVAVGPWALGTLAATSLGFSGDDEEDLRQFLPDWQKNSQLIIIGKNGSEVNYVDVSYLDPFEIWKKPMTAFMRGLGRAENVEEFFTEAVVGAAIEAGRPFTSEQILSGAIMDVMRNRDANGRQVYNPQDTGTAIANAVGKKLASAFAPGTLDTGDRIVKAIGGQISETGRDYNVANEVFGVPLGSRVSAVDAEQALGFKASQFLRARRDARSIFNRDYLSRGSRSESDVISAYQRSNAGLRDVTEQLRREYIAAINLGVSPAKARSVLRAAGLDRDSARMVSTGIYRRLTPSEEQDRMAAPERKRAARQAIAETPQREVLFP